jgi:transposase, IS30 family
MAARLSFEERVRIEVGIGSGRSDEEIAVELGRARSSVWREWSRCGSRVSYRAGVAQTAAGVRAARPKQPKLAQDPELAGLVAAGLARRWSPHAIAVWLVTVAAVGVCAETIYRACYTNHARSGLAAGSWKLLPDCRRRRRPRRRVEQTRRHKALGDYRSIHDRPPGAGDRSEAGHWEGDLIIGARGRSAVVTLVERVSRYVICVDLPNGHTAPELVAALIEAFGTVPRRLRRSLTWDQGTEMAAWATTETGIGMPIYFADPHSPWQRPANEHANRCLRRWLPKSTCLHVGLTRLQEITSHLNHMPRRTLGWRSAHHHYTALCRGYR